VDFISQGIGIFRDILSREKHFRAFFRGKTGRPDGLLTVFPSGRGLKIKAFRAILLEKIRKKRHSLSEKMWKIKKIAN